MRVQGQDVVDGSSTHRNGSLRWPPRVSDRRRRTMPPRCRSALRTLPVLGTAVAFSGCGGLLFEVACTLELRSSVAIEVRDPVTGAPAARGVTGWSEHESGITTEFATSGDLLLHGNWRSELPGHHVIHLRKPVFRTEVLTVDVGGDDCHVEPATVRAHMEPNPLAVPQHPLSFIEGPEIDAWPASAGVKIYGDTLEVRGFAPNGCTRLRAVAYRQASGFLHVQVEPSDIPLDRCASPRQFEVRYRLRLNGPISTLPTAAAFPSSSSAGRYGHPAKAERGARRGGAKPVSPTGCRRPPPGTVDAGGLSWSGRLGRVNSELFLHEPDAAFAAV